MTTIGIEELAELMGLSVDSIYRRRCYMPKTVPPATKLGGRLRWNLDTVERFMKDHEEEVAR